ncbi:MAG TPA: nuclear transport factor 2 family protein [Thermomicrobiales bacterium]|nr:nuclear transport factor 2 family protein [Thermomicrobiales bacterium]
MPGTVPRSFPREAGRTTAKAILGAFLIVVFSLLPVIAAAQGEDEATFAGAYAVSIGEEDVPLSLIGAATLEGSWVVRFDQDGRYTIERQDVGELVSGSFEVQDDRVTVTDEAGLLSCGNPQPVGETDPIATYSWQKTGDLLRLEPEHEECHTRRVLFATRALVPFVVCQTVPLELSDEGTNAGDSGPGSGLDLPRAAQEDEGTPAPSTPVSGEEVPQTREEIGTADDPEEAIIDLLGQLNACWATGDPARVLPLLSESFLDSATGGGVLSLEEVAADFRQLQTTPIIWELAGDIEVDGDEAEAVVAATIGGEELLQTFRFVREDDGWRLANLGE